MKERITKISSIYRKVRHSKSYCFNKSKKVNMEVIRQRKNSVKNDVQKVVFEWLEGSTSHGLPNAVKAKNNIIRILWIMFFLISLGVCAFVLVKYLISYFKYEVNVQISVAQEYPTRFPAITICNMNLFNDKFSTSNYLYDLLANNNNELINDLKNMDLDSVSGYNRSPCEVLADVTEVTKRLVATDKTLTVQQRRSLGYDLFKDMLISCSFNKATCNASNFTSFINYDYGNCYTFNQDKDNTLYSSTTGSNGGLQLELKIIDNAYGIIKFTSKTGLYLIINNQTRLPITIGDGDALNIPTGFDTYVSINREYRSKLDKPYSTCLRELEANTDYGKKLFHFMKALNFTLYDQRFCYKMCYQDKLIDKCNCADARYPRIRNVDYCISDEQLNCLNVFSRIYTTTNIETFCESACPQECDIMLYKLTSSMAIFPTKYYQDLFATKNIYLTGDSASSEYSRENVLKLTVNYAELDYTIIQEAPSITVETLIGNIGGQLGLFLGISLLSLIEILELIVKIMDMFYEKYKNKRNKKPFIVDNVSG